MKKRMKRNYQKMKDTNHLNFFWSIVALHKSLIKGVYVYIHKNKHTHINANHCEILRYQR